MTVKTIKYVWISWQLEYSVVTSQSGKWSALIYMYQEPRTRRNSQLHLSCELIWTTCRKNYLLYNLRTINWEIWIQLTADWFIFTAYTTSLLIINRCLCLNYLWLWPVVHHSLLWIPDVCMIDTYLLCVYHLFWE